MRRKVLIAVGLLLTVAYWIVLVFRIRVFTVIPGFFWHSMAYIDKKLPDLWLIIPVVLFSFIILFIILRRSRIRILNLLALIFLGWCIQMAFGFMEGRGVDGISDRMVNTGHAEFARIAARMDDVSVVATRYEDLMKTSVSAVYVHTKPPGQLLFYMLTQKASTLTSPTKYVDARHNRLITFAGYVWPALTYLVLIPMFYFARHFVKEEIAMKACIIYLFLPNVTLVTLHLDQVIYPTLAMLCLYFITAAYYRNSLWRAILCGISIYLALFVTFSLSPVIFMVILLAAVFFLKDDSKTRTWKQIGIPLIGTAAGVLVMFLVFKLWLNYDPFLRFENAMKFHQYWERWKPGTGEILLYGLLNFIEYACWIGLPVAVLFVSNAARSVTDVIRRHGQILSYFSICVVAVFIMIALFGKTKSEVARLWIFMAGPLCILVSHELHLLFKEKINWAFGGLLALQLTTILIIKRFQDFW